MWMLSMLRPEALGPGAASRLSRKCGVFGGEGRAVVGGPQPGVGRAQFAGQRSASGFDARARGGVDDGVVERSAASRSAANPCRGRRWRVWLGRGGRSAGGWCRGAARAGGSGSSVMRNSLSAW